MLTTAAVVLSLVGSATAFVAPSSNALVSSRAGAQSALRMATEDMQNMSGATAPVPYFDPAGFSANTDSTELQKYREAELKHGRVAMLAALGMVVQENFHPFFGTAGQDIGPASFHLQQVDNNYPKLSLILLGGIALIEAFTIKKGWSTTNYKDSGLGAGFVANLEDDYFPGDLGFDPLGLYPSSPEARTDIRNKELNNGRLAMIAIWGMWAQELVDGLTLGEHFSRYGFGPAVDAATAAQASL